MAYTAAPTQRRAPTVAAFACLSAAQHTARSRCCARYSRVLFRAARDGAYDDKRFGERA